MLHECPIYIVRKSTWTPEQNPTDVPPLPFAPPLFKRRLSQLSRMVIHVVHEVLQYRTNIPVTFASIYGEIVQQYRISQGILDSVDVSPAHFSLSVFNTPVAASSIVEKNTAGYTAICSGKDSFKDGLRASIASLQSGICKERIFVYADELLPEPYQVLMGGPNIPCAQALFLSTENTPGSTLLETHP